MRSIEQAISELGRKNDRGIDSEHSRMIALLEALNEIAEQLSNITQVLNHQGLKG